MTPKKRPILIEQVFLFLAPLWNYIPEAEIHMKAPLQIFISIEITKNDSFVYKSLYWIFHFRVACFVHVISFLKNGSPAGNFSI